MKDEKKKKIVQASGFKYSLKIGFSLTVKIMQDVTVTFTNNGNSLNEA